MGNEAGQGAIRLMGTNVRSIVYSHCRAIPEVSRNQTGEDQEDVTPENGSLGQRKDAQNQYGMVCFQDNTESEVTILCKPKLD